MLERLITPKNAAVTSVILGSAVVFEAFKRGIPEGNIPLMYAALAGSIGIGVVCTFLADKYQQTLNRRDTARSVERSLFPQLEVTSKNRS